MPKLTSVLSKIVSLSDATHTVAQWKKEGNKVVFTNGVFDLLHLGHVDYLSKAADCGDKLVIGLNADSSVLSLNKGPARPIKDQQTRSTILAALQFVDVVIIFDQDTPYDLVNALLPDVLVKGGDYDANCTDASDKTYIVGSDIVRANGGTVAVIPFLPGHSTTRLEQKIIELNK